MTKDEISIKGKLLALEYIYLTDLSERLKSDSDALETIDSYKKRILGEMNDIPLPPNGDELETHKAALVAAIGFLSEVEKRLRRTGSGYQ